MSREVQPTNGITLLVFLITGYVIIFAQARMTFFRDFFGAQPDLLPGMIVYAAMAFKLETVMVCVCVRLRVVVRFFFTEPSWHHRRDTRGDWIRGFPLS